MGGTVKLLTAKYLTYSLIYDYKLSYIRKSSDEMVKAATILDVNKVR